MSGSSHLSRRLRFSIFVRSLSLQASWNHERMQNIGLLATMMPWLQIRNRHLSRDRLFVRRYYEFFNTNPYLANFVIGGLVRLEDDREAGVDMSAGVTAMFRDSLGRAFAGLGDQLFWLGIRPVVVMTICGLGLYDQMTALLVVIAVFAVGQLCLRWQSLAIGYRLGFDLVELLHDPRWHRYIGIAERVGMALTGVVTGMYLVMVRDAGPSLGGGGVWLGVGVGVGLPLVLRRRLPGDVLILVALLLAGLVTFANSWLGS